MAEAIIRTMEDGILFVAAAGNDAKNTDSNPNYPSSYDIDNIISVCSTNHHDGFSSTFSNYGVYSVDLGAPGGGDKDNLGSSENIFSLASSGGCQYLPGTSMSAPFVSGTAALVLGQRPTIGWWHNKTVLLKSVDSLSSLISRAHTHGRLNAYNALNYTTPVLPDAPSDLAGTATENGGMYEITLTWNDNSNNETGFNIYLKSGNVYQLLDSVPANTTSYVLSDVGSGYYYFYVRAYRTDGESTKTDVATVKAY